MDLLTENNNFKSNEGLKTQHLEAIMAEAGRKRKKTRRGKKKSLKRSADWSCDIDKKLAEESRRMQQMIKKAVRTGKTLRPCSSPKAPMNSTQFLIEDSGNGRLSFDILDNASPFSSPDPDQTVMFEDENRFEDSSFYDDEDTCKMSFGDDDEYVPMNLDETTKFVEREFERDLQSLNFNFNERLDERKSYFESKSQEELVSEYMKLENDLNITQQSCYKKSCSSTSLHKDVERLRNENVKLIEENSLLRSLLQ